MKKVFGLALGILTAIGGFLDIGDLVTNAVVWLPIRTLARLGRSDRSARNLHLRSDVWSGRCCERPCDVRAAPGAPRPTACGDKPGCLIHDQLNDSDRRGRWSGPRPSAGQ